MARQKCDNVFFVYIDWTLEDQSQAFYIGKGKLERVQRRERDNDHWHNIVAKHGFRCEVILATKDESYAFTQEILGILEHGTFCGSTQYRWGANKTPGGDGVVMTPEIVIKLKAAWTSEKRTKQGHRMFGDDNPMRDPEVVARARVAISRGCLNVKKSPEHRQNIAKAKLGSLNPRYGKRGINALPTETCERIVQALSNDEGVTSIARREGVSLTLVKSFKNGSHWFVKLK